MAKPLQLRFQDGKCLGLFVDESAPDQVSTTWASYSVDSLAAAGLLSFTDRFVLDQLAARVDRIARALAEASR